MSDNPEDRVEDLEDQNNGPEDQNAKDNDEGKQDTKKGPDADNDDADDDDDEPTGQKTYTAAEFEKAVKRRQAALKRAQEAEKRAKELEKQHATKEQRLQIEAEEKAAQQAARFKPALVRQHVSYEMAFLGLNKQQIEQVVKFVDMENIDVDLEDNSVEGVEEEVVRIKSLFPDLFPTPGSSNESGARKTAKKKPVPRGDGAEKQAPKRQLSAKEQLIAKLRGE